MVYLHSPRVFHSLIDLSREEETICLLSGEKQTERTSLVCPTNRRVVFPVAISQRRRVLSTFMIEDIQLVEINQRRFWQYDCEYRVRCDFIRFQWIKKKQIVCNQERLPVSPTNENHLKGSTSNQSADTHEITIHHLKSSTRPLNFCDRI